jgi:predicted DsbA family dithiol-disulfide isomerase
MSSVPGATSESDSLKQLWLGFPRREEVDVAFRSFELDPLAPERQELPLIELMKHRYSMSDQQAREANDRITSSAAQVGLEYHLLDARGATPSTLIG